LEHRQIRHADHGRLAELGDVGASGERAPAPHEQKAAHGRVVLALLDGVQDALQHPLAHAERVHGRIVERDHAQMALDRVASDVGHGVEIP
jgi:hypothetical protein